MWEMGGYGIYVWPAYAVVLLGLLGLMARSLHQAKQQKNKLRQKIKQVKI